MKEKITQAFIGDYVRDLRNADLLVEMQEVIKGIGNARVLMVYGAGVIGAGRFVGKVLENTPALVSSPAKLVSRTTMAGGTLLLGAGLLGEFIGHQAMSAIRQEQDRRNGEILRSKQK